MFMLYYFVFKGIFRCCFDNLFVIFYCIVEMNILLIEDGKYVVLGCYLFYKKEMYVCQLRDKLQVVKKKNVLLNRKLVNGQEITGIVMEIF